MTLFCVLNVRTTEGGIGMIEVDGTDIHGWIKIQRSVAEIGDCNESSHHGGGKVCCHFVMVG